jgi:regulatory protein
METEFVPPTPDEAKEKALRLLDRRDMSKKELTDKLIEKDVSPDDAQRAADRMEELHLIDDARYAGLVARHYASKGYGLRRIREEFFRRGVPRDAWEAALEDLKTPDETIDRLLRLKLRGREEDSAGLKKACDALSRRGFSWEEIQSAAQRYQKESKD